MIPDRHEKIMINVVADDNAFERKCRKCLSDKLIEKAADGDQYIDVFQNALKL